MLKWIVRVIAGLVVVVLAAGAAGFGYRAWRQDQAERLLVLSGPQAIDEARFIDVRGVEQWITIRGEDRGNPAILFVHGGPGSALSPLAPAFLPFERDYVVAHWDQQGAGRTFGRAGREIPAELTPGDLIQDGIEVAETLRRELGKDRLIVVGLSWGSMVASGMARQRPDLFYAFVGTGQAVHRDDGRIAVHRLLLERARAAGDAGAVAELEEAGAPPYTDEASARIERKWLDTYLPEESSGWERIGEVLLTPRYTLADVRNYLLGFVASDEQFDTGLIDLRRESLEYAVPVFIIQGTDDTTTPESLARSYFDSINAPRKEFIPIQGGGHMALLDNMDEFISHMDARVRPLAAPALAIPAGPGG